MIIENKKARFEYIFKEHHVAGIELQGWEVKSIRSKKLSMASPHIYVRDGEMFLVGLTITPLQTASTHVVTDAQRTRKLLMKKSEIMKLFGQVQLKRMTIVPVSLEWVKGRVKVNLALAQGKNNADKRQTEKDRDWAREQNALMKRKS
jgi:SsrA-binding protein